MAGARNVHNRITGNIFGILHARLRGKLCQPWNSDTKIRVRLPLHVRFYYPDASVICHPNPLEDSYHDQPAVIVEVLSRSTRRIDEGEKKDAYVTIPSLSVYLLVESESAAVVAFRRSDQGFVREDYDGLDAIIPLPEIRCELPLADLYDGVTFIAEPDETDDEH
jgi:Uma2 family endonuclease